MTTLALHLCGYSKLGTVVVRENGHINVTIETYLLLQNPKAFGMSPEPRNSVLILTTKPALAKARTKWTSWCLFTVLYISVGFLEVGVQRGRQKINK